MAPHWSSIYGRPSTCIAGYDQAVAVGRQDFDGALSRTASAARTRRVIVLAAGPAALQLLAAALKAPPKVPLRTHRKRHSVKVR